METTYRRTGSDLFASRNGGARKPASYLKQFRWSRCKPMPNAGLWNPMNTGSQETFEPRQMQRVLDIFNKTRGVEECEI